MESLNSNDKKVNKQSTVKSLIENNPSTFNGLADAVDGLANITDKGIDRIIKAVNGLSKAVSTSNSDTVQEAASKVIAREMHTSEQIIEIEINDDKESARPVVNRAEKSFDIENALASFKPEKPKSIDIGRALASFKNDKPSFYQHAPEVSNASETTNNTQNSTVNSPVGAQSTQINNTVNANAGGRETVFNQLSELQTKQLDTLEKVTEIDTKVSGVNDGVTVTHNKATSQAKNQTTLNGDQVIDVNVVGNTANNSVSSVSASNNSAVTNNAKAGNTTNRPTSNTNARPTKNMTVGRPVFERPISSATSNEANTISNSIALPTKELTSIKESVSDLSESVKERAQHSVNTTNNVVTTHYSNGNTKTAKTTSTRTSAVNSATNNAANNTENSTANNSTGGTNNSSQATATANRLSTTSNAAQSNSTATAIDGDVTSVDPITEQPNAPTSNANATNQPSKSKSTSGFYKDAGGRLRTAKGKFATKEEIKQYQKEQKKGSIKSSIAKHLTGRRSRTIVGTAFLGSAYPALEEAFHLSKTVKNAVNERGLNSVDGVKKYAAMKRDKLTSTASSAIDNTKNTSKSVFSKVRNLLFRNKNQTSTSEGGNETANAGATTHTNNANSVSNSSIGNSVNATSEQAVNSNSVNAVNGGDNTTNTGETNANIGTAITNSQAGGIDSLTTHNDAPLKSATSTVNTANNVTEIQNNTRPSTVDGSPVKPVNRVAGGAKAKNKGRVKGRVQPITPASKTTTIGNHSASQNNVKSVEKYLARNSRKSSNKSAMKGGLPLTNSVFIGAQKSSNGMSKKLSKEYHDAHMLKLDKVIKAMGDIKTGGAGGGGGSIIDDVLDLNRDRKRRKNRRNRNRQPRPRSRFGRAKDSLMAGRFFGGGARAAGAIGAGAAGAGGAAGVAGAGATAVGGAGGAAGRLGMGALGGAGRLVSKAIPILALATTAMDAYSGFTDTDKQRETFNLKSTEEANLGQKTSMALGSVLDLGGLTSGISGLIGDGLGALGFDGAKEAMNFDSGDIAKAIYDKGDAIATSGSGIFSSLGEGDFSGAAGNAAMLLKEVIPALGWFTGSDSDKKEEETKTNSEKTTSEQSSSTEESTKFSHIQDRVDASRKRAEEMKARSSALPVEPVGESDELEGGSRISSRVQKRIDAKRKRAEEIKAQQGTETGISTSDLTINGIPAITQSSSIENNAPITEALTMSSNKESVTDVSTLTKDTQSNSADPAKPERAKGNEPIIITDNARTHALLKEISNKLELNRKTEKPNNSQPRGGVNSMPTSIPAQFSDPLMERLANE